MSEHPVTPLPAAALQEPVHADPKNTRVDLDSLPPLLADSSFWGLTITQFLGAFNDNLVKQTLFLLFVAVPFSVKFAETTDLPTLASQTHELGHLGQVTKDMQGLAMATFSLPFIFFSGFAGYLSDRYSKRKIIVLCKVAEIAITSVGVGAFAWYSASSLSPALVTVFSIILFLMGTHSAFFGPGKYGVLPEMLRERDLPTANGLVLMTTFLAIILGSVLAGLLLDWLDDRLWISGLCGVGIAALGTVTSLVIRRVRPARPDLRFRAEALGVPSDVRELLWADRPLFAAILASTAFWLSAALVLSAVNGFGKNQLEAGNTWTSWLVSCISIGIVFGSLIGGAASRGRFNTRVLWIGLWGMIVSLGLLAVPGPAAWHSHLLGYWGSLVMLIVLGAFTGLFAVPLQVFVQARAPADSKGRVIAAQNLFQWIGITGSAGLYWLFARLLDWLHWPPCGMFALIGLIMLGVAIVYRPREEPHMTLAERHKSG